MKYLTILSFLLFLSCGAGLKQAKGNLDEAREFQIFETVNSEFIDRTKELHSDHQEIEETVRAIQPGAAQSKDDLAQYRKDVNKHIELSKANEDHRLNYISNMRDKLDEVGVSVSTQNKYLRQVEANESATQKKEVTLYQTYQKLDALLLKNIDALEKDYGNWTIEGTTVNFKENAAKTDSYAKNQKEIEGLVKSINKMIRGL